MSEMLTTSSLEQHILFISGWQPRWFILSESGILSYYSSHDEVDQGCKGSMNVAACEIVVSTTDTTRLDIIVSHEKVITVKSLAS